MHNADLGNHTPADVLAAYERLATVTARMRLAASQEDWDRVVELETECASEYTRLAALERGASGDAAYQRRKSELICKLLEDDADIRERVNGQLARIWRMIDGRSRVMQLDTAYGAAGSQHAGRE